MNKITKVELIDSENNNWWILLRENMVLSVMTSALPMVFRLKPNLKVKVIVRKKKI